MGMFFVLFLGEDTVKLEKMLKTRKNKMILLQSEIDAIEQELQKRNEK